MPLAAFTLAILTAAIQSPAPQSDPILVTGHVWAAFISPMGEPFRPHAPGDDTLADWFRQADSNHDGVLTVAEMQADADRFFATLDADHDGEIDPDELTHYEWEIAPDIQVMSRTRRAAGDTSATMRRAGAERGRTDGQWRRGASDEDDVGRDGALGRGGGMDGGLQGAARYALLNIPEPVASADTDFDRGITLSEFRQAAVARFQLLDSKHQGKLSLSQLEALRATMLAAGRARKRPNDAVDTRVGNTLPKGN
jgi:Ca2+-binding EF-hand superfamily protein